MREPLILPLAAIGGGILIANGLSMSIRDAAWPVAAFTALAGLAGFVGSARLRSTSLLLGCVFAGALSESWHSPGPPPVLDARSKEIVLLEGCIVEPTAFSQDREQFTLELAKGARARVTLPLDDSEAAGAKLLAPGERAIPRFHYGQRVELEARVRTPKNFQNPGSFDYVQYLARRGIYWTAAIPARSPPPRVLDGSCGRPLWKPIYDLREMGLDRIDRLFSGDEYATGMMQAILLGENSRLEKIWTENFRKTGTVHALVISGTHVAVLAMVLLFLLRRVGLPEMGSLAATAGAAWLYALVSGFSPPVLRAAGGFTLYLGARFLFRRGRALNLLAGIAIVYLLWDPASLSDASFQLSFVAAAALGALAIPILDAGLTKYQAGLRGIGQLERDPHLPPPVAQMRVEIRLAAEAVAGLLLPKRASGRSTMWTAALMTALLRVVLFGAELLLISAVMQIGLAIPMAAYFHRVSFTGLTANLLIVPLLEFLVPLGFAAMFSRSAALASLSAWVLSQAAGIAAWHASWEPAWRIADPPMWLSLMLGVSLICVAICVRHRGWTRTSLLAALLSFALLLWQPWPPPRQPGILELTAIDVGQGDSLLVVFPDGATMLVDGGGLLSYGRKRKPPRLDIGEDVVSPYLWHRGIRRLDIVAVTHAHEDHAGGVNAVVENFRPRQIWSGAHPPPALKLQAAQLGIPLVEAKKGWGTWMSGARVEIQSPLAEISEMPAGNNDSLVMRIAFGKRSFLLTGDIERPVERLLEANGILRHADVLKVGHHGSKTSTSSEFLAAVTPSVAVISVGLENSFGHPHPEVIERLTDSHVTLLRTDLDGLVTIRTDGSNIFFGNDLWEKASNTAGWLGGFPRGWEQILVH